MSLLEINYEDNVDVDDAIHQLEKIIKDYTNSLQVAQLYGQTITKTQVRARLGLVEPTLEKLDDTVMDLLASHKKQQKTIDKLKIGDEQQKKIIRKLQAQTQDLHKRLQEIEGEKESEEDRSIVVNELEEIIKIGTDPLPPNF